MTGEKFEFTRKVETMNETRHHTGWLDPWGKHGLTESTARKRFADELRRLRAIDRGRAQLFRYEVGAGLRTEHPAASGCGENEERLI